MFLVRHAAVDSQTVGELELGGAGGGPWPPGGLLALVLPGAHVVHHGLAHAERDVAGVGARHHHVHQGHVGHGGGVGARDGDHDGGNLITLNKVNFRFSNT